MPIEKTFEFVWYIRSKSNHVVSHVLCAKFSMTSFALHHLVEVITRTCVLSALLVSVLIVGVKDVGDYGSKLKCTRVVDKDHCRALF